MLKSVRVPERAFGLAMWGLSIVFAIFLIGLGRLVIGDMPNVDQPVELSQFVDQRGADQIRTEYRALQLKEDEGARKRSLEALSLQAARNDYDGARQAFDNWISARRATVDPRHDPMVIAQTRGLDALNAKVRASERTVEDLDLAAEKLRQQRDALDRRQQALEKAASGAYEHALFVQEFRVFALRLLVTLPLILISGWLIVKKRKSPYWPLIRGFVLFSLFAFFVELLPYLPSYGGYVRYIVGILLTIAASHYLIRWMQHYRATRAVDEQKAEAERRQSIGYEEALKKISSHICPGCERPIATTGDAPTDFCVHCGMQLYDHCESCDTRKLAFFRFCMKCGTATKATVTP